MRYRKTPDGGKVSFPRKTIQKIGCCDCGLVHSVKTISGQAVTTWTRDNRATAAKRRGKCAFVRRKMKP